MPAVVIAYEKGSGGNFLANCLSLSNGAVFRSLKLCKQQLHGKFDSTEKLNYLLRELSKINSDNSWKDLGLGDPTVDEYHFYKLLNDKTFFLSAHTVEEIAHWKTIFPELMLISIINSRKFIMEYRPSRLFDYTNIIELKKHWNQIKKPSWPHDPPAWQESLQFSPFNQYQLLEDNTFLSLLPSQQQVLEYYKNTDCRLSAFANIVWDAEWFFDKATLCNNINQLYHYANLGCPDNDKILRYYDAWISIIKKYIT